MTRGNPSDLQPFDPEIDKTFHRLVRHHLVPFEHPEHSVIGDFKHYSFEHSDFEYSENMSLNLWQDTPCGHISEVSG